MDEETTQRKEMWLKLFIENSDDRWLDSAVYLVVIWSLASFGGTCSGSAQKPKEWIAALKRHPRGSRNTNCWMLQLGNMRLGEILGSIWCSEVREVVKLFSEIQGLKERTRGWTGAQHNTCSKHRLLELLLNMRFKMWGKTGIEGYFCT